MSELPSKMQAQLDSGATGLCHCWRIRRRDGVMLGFTDHDRFLRFDGLTFEADAGFTASAIAANTGLAVDTHSVQGALSSARISEADITKGLYDGAEIALWRVDWRDPEIRYLLSRGHIGEITRGKNAFEAEIVGLSDVLNQPNGRIYLHSCCLRLGAKGCGVDVNDPRYRGAGRVNLAQEPQRLAVEGLDGFAPGWFAGGALHWISGANAGLSGHVKAHLARADGVVIELWLEPPLAVLPGDTFSITAGCDKTAETCRIKFDNILNFRGFPFMPGDDFSAGYPTSGGNHDGGSLYR